MKKLLLLTLLCCSTAIGQENNGIYIGGSKERSESGDNWTAELGVHGTFANYLLVQGSLMYFEQNNLVYEGGNLSFNLTNGGPLSFYAGVGAFLGTQEECIDSTIGNVCRDTFTAGLYPETGFIITIGRSSFGAFARRYKTFDSGRNLFTMYGLKLGTSY